jgi:hypothetical protein
MTVHQRYALAILEQRAQPGVITSGATAIYDGQPWINWRTAFSLRDRGLVTIDEDQAFVYLGALRNKQHSEGGS